MVQDGLLERRSGIGVFVNRIRTEARNREVNAMLVDAVDTVVNLALQMKISEQEASRLLNERYRKAARRSDTQ
jgi:DNA-binding transcriptional regulator YhcF (GntR family)